MDERVEIVKTYPAKTGVVTVTRYLETDEFKVKHSNPDLCFCTEWHPYKLAAIAHAQLLSRY